MTTSDPSHPGVRLLLMRHAKAAYPDNCSDHDRPLAPRGRTEAVAAGQWLAETGWVPDRIICSDAVRTMQTAELVVEGLGAEVKVEADPSLYEADVSTVLEVVSQTGKAVHTLLVIGHEPIMSAATATICDKFAHFPTAAVAQIELPDWHVEPDSGRLISVRTPKD